MHAPAGAHTRFARADAVTEAGSTDSSVVTVIVRPSSEAVASTSIGPVTSGAKREFCAPGVPPAGSVVVPKLAADVLEPFGSRRSRDASLPPHEGVYGTASTSVGPRTRAGRSPELLSAGKPPSSMNATPG